MAYLCPPPLSLRPDKTLCSLSLSVRHDKNLFFSLSSRSLYMSVCPFLSVSLSVRHDEKKFFLSSPPPLSVRPDHPPPPPPRPLRPVTFPHLSRLLALALSSCEGSYLWVSCITLHTRRRRASKMGLRNRVLRATIVCFQPFWIKYALLLFGMDTSGRRDETGWWGVGGKNEDCCIIV